MNLVTSAEILLFILYKYEFIYMHDAEITLIIVFVLLNINYFRQNCMNSIYVKFLLFASTHCTCTMYLSTRLHSIIATSCARKKNPEYNFSDDAVILMTCISHTTA